MDEQMNLWSPWNRNYSGQDNTQFWSTPAKNNAWGA